MKRSYSAITIFSFLFMTVFIAQSGWPVQAAAEELTPAQQRAVDEAVRKYLEQQGVPGGGGTQVSPPPGAADESDSKSLKQLGKPRSQSQYDSTMEGSGTLIFARPFVSSPKAIVGG